MADASLRCISHASGIYRCEVKSKQGESNAQGRIHREETFEQVEAIVKQGKSKTEAFAQVASDTGRNTGTVSANYYRVARANGVVKSRRRASTKATSGTPRTRTPRTTARRGTNDIDRLAADLVKSVTALADAIKSQQAEVASLRNRLEGVRQAVG